MRLSSCLVTLSPLALALASCGGTPAGDNSPTSNPVKAATPTPPASGPKADFTVTEVARFSSPWAIAFLPGTPYALITEKAGKLKLWEDGGAVRDVGGVPEVANAGQGGLGDIVLAPDFATTGTVYLSWAQFGEADTSGAVVGRARLVLDGTPRLDGLRVIWRQQPKVSGTGHFSHRIAFSPDGQYLFVSSGDRQKFTPAQDLAGNLGKILRLLPDGTAAPGNPFASRGGVAAQIWSYGHRNVLGLQFDASGRLWGLEHGPRGGDELNLIEPGRNYGWPLVSDGDHYDGRAIPRNATRPDLAMPAISWNPVIAPGNFIVYRGDAFPAWKGQAIIAAMQPAGLVRVGIEGTKATELARYPLDHRIRDIAERGDGSIWLLEDGKDSRAGRLLKLSAR